MKAVKLPTGVTCYQFKQNNGKTLIIVIPTVKQRWSYVKRFFTNIYLNIF